jgi:hypothetical protein
LEAKGVKTIPHPPYSTDPTLTDFFFFPRVKSKLAGLTLTKKSFTSSWEGIIWTIPKDDFATAFQRWME